MYKRQRYKDSEPLHATHDKDLLATRAEKPQGPPPTVPKSDAPATASTSLLSNVCCQDVDTEASQIAARPAKKTRTVSAFQPPPAPQGGLTFTLGILTVSDRAAANQYETGDLSGPAVAVAVHSTVQALGKTVSCNIVRNAIVPDNVKQIQEILKEWCDGCDLILTTGGTGFAPRDVTPEATVGIVEKECRGLLSFVATECSQQQPLASLSRGTAGILKNTIIANLPGNPKGVEEIVPVLLPILVHAISDMKQSQ